MRLSHFVASELKDPICHSDECQIGSFSSEATIYLPMPVRINVLHISLYLLVHFRHANEHKPAEKPSPTILLNLSTVLTELISSIVISAKLYKD